MTTNTDCGPTAVKNYCIIHGYIPPLTPETFPDTGDFWDDLWDNQDNHMEMMGDIHVPPKADILLCINKNSWLRWHWVVYLREQNVIHSGYYLETTQSFKERWWVVHTYNHKNWNKWLLWKIYNNLVSKPLLFLRRIISG